jgi:hypothetical protein
MMHDLLADAVAEHRYRALFTERAYLNYIRANGINTRASIGFSGPTCAAMILDCGNQRFEISDDREAFPGFVCLAFDHDGVTPIDLVAWPLDRPKHVLSMFGRAGMLGLWQATNAGTYAMGRPLRLHRTPLEWMQSDCHGAAIVTPHLARWTLLEISGQIVAQDQAHGRDLLALVQSLVDPSRFLAPASMPRIAA